MTYRLDCDDYLYIYTTVCRDVLFAFIHTHIYSGWIYYRHIYLTLTPYIYWQLLYPYILIIFACRITKMVLFTTNGNVAMIWESMLEGQTWRCNGSVGAGYWWSLRRCHRYVLCWVLSRRSNRVQILLSPLKVKVALECRKCMISYFGWVYRILMAGVEEVDAFSVVCTITNQDFLWEYCVSRKSFKELHDLIKDCFICKRGNLGLKQAPSEFQNLIFLCFVGLCGDGNSSHQISCFPYKCWFNRDDKDKIVKGSSRTTTWPDKSEQKELVSRIYAKFYWPNCFFIVDWTLFSFATTKPPQL